MENNSFLERTFKLKEHQTNVRTEVMAGITTFMTMAYILIVNPAMLSEAGMDFGGVFTATVLASIIATVIMALYANYPFVLSAGMGLNAFFVYTVVFGMGHSWQFALTAVFLEGIIFIVMSLFNIREAIFNSIPFNLKKAVSVGIGLFIALIGFVNSGIVTAEGGTIVNAGDLTSAGPLVTIIGLIVTGVLLSKNIKGAILIGILVSTIVAIPMGVATLPDKIFSLPPSVAPVALQLEWGSIFTKDMLIVVFTFLFVDVFDTIGTLIGVSTKANMLDENGKLPKVGRALFADAIGTTAGALLGTSTVTTYVESAAGVAEGGRTGLTALTAAGMFAISLLFYPIFLIVPGQATAPALIIVGLFMMSPIKEIDFSDYTEAIPVFLTITAMPFTYSIAEGIIFGMVSYVVLKLLAGKTKDISPLMYFLAILFVVKIILS